MLTVELIAKKQRGEELSREEIAAVIRDFTDGTVPDYQMAALLMAIYFRGLSDDEGQTFLRAMVGSGLRLTLSSVNGIKVDKHSTGGVGDKTSLIVAPVVAAAGVPIPMISGRALGHTGGTLDKLESIPGFHVNLEEEEFENVLRQTGCAFGAQTEAIVPADRKLYALRDVTATVSIPPLIAASILSKKIAEGADALVMDVKVGSGGFLRSEEEARRLSEMIVRWSAAEGIKTIVFGTDMERPLGRAAGNAPEVLECIEILRTGKGESRLLSVCHWLGAAMLLLGEKAKTLGEAVKLFDATLSSGAGLAKLAEIATAQGSNAHTVEHFEQTWKPAHRHEIRASRSGFVQSVAAREVGYALVDLGAGRRKATDRVDHSAGVWFEKQVGDEVKEGELMATAYWSGNDSSQAGLGRLHRAISIADAPPVAVPLFKFYCDEGGVRMTDDILSGT